MRRLARASVFLALVLWGSLSVALGDWSTGDLVALRARSDQGVPLHGRAGSDLIGRAPDGAIAEVLQLSRNKRWALLRLADGREGWVTRRYIEGRSDGPRPVGPTPGRPAEEPIGFSPYGPPDHYYAGAEDLSGARLEQKLQGIIDGHHQFTLDEVWDQIVYTDEDPNAAGHVILLYTGRSVPIWRRVRSSGRDLDAWNREHVWAKSHGFRGRGQMAHTDLHHLRPSDVSVNTDRGNHDFDFSDEPHTEAAGARLDRNSFEPPDRVKGDVARMMFYMDVRYSHEGASGDLELVNRDTREGEPRFGWLCVLMGWHEMDPVDDWERRRNHRIFERQGNRNPFIDHPDFAARIWGPECQ